MARSQVTTWWTTIVTAFFALLAALGFATQTASAAVPQAETASKSVGVKPVTVPAPSVRPWFRSGSLPPTMKQRIRAEAHGNAPGCRPRSTEEATAAEPLAPSAPCAPDTTADRRPAPADAPLRR
ncbi:DUF6344 domain-containing protein [Streptomyces sp. ZYX-F-203]